MPTLVTVALAMLWIAGCSASNPHKPDDDDTAQATGGATAAPPVQNSGGTSAGASGNGSGGAPMVMTGGSGGQTPACEPAACPVTPADAGQTPAASIDAGVNGDDGVEEAGGPFPNPKYLVPATGPCPEFADGYAMFHPDGVDRRVLLYMSDAAKTGGGPLIFSWHTTLPGPDSANLWLGDAQIEEIKALGGVVAAPATGYPNETRPWDSIPQGSDQDVDQRLMDEVVACAIDAVNIDVRHIHAIGMSAGGLKTAQVSLRRSGYIASVVVYSGGLVEGDMPPDQDPSNPVAAMILYGGASDISPVDGIDYLAASERYRDALRAGGRFAFLCDHGGGHSVPSDSQASAWRFMQDHGFGTKPSPYATALPNDFLSYCALAP